ncbi:MAG: FAD-dependent oxidoreductase [Phycisphaerae bacterium]
MPEIYDVVIVGAGPAGLAAAIYTSRDRHKTIILDKSIPGGQINNTDRIENYPGFLRVSGAELVGNMENQCRTFGAEIRQLAAVTAVKALPDGKISVEINGEEQILTRVVILTPGSDYRKLGIPGEDRFRQSGTGVSYCGTCDAPFYQDKTVVSVGGGNTAIQETLHLAKYVKKLYLVHRRDQFRAEKILVEELDREVQAGKIELVLDTTLISIEGKDRVEYVKTKNIKTAHEGVIECDGVFVFIGMVPNTHFLKGFVPLDEHGFVQCDPWYLRTSIPGIFVAGDCRTAAAMQLATAAGDGVAVAMTVSKYLTDPAWWTKPGP